MPEATFWFSSPFREWIGQRTLTIRWEGRTTLLEVLERLGAAHPAFRTNVMRGGPTQEGFNQLAAVIVDGDFLALSATIPDGAKVHVFTPGRRRGPANQGFRALARDVCLTLPSYQC